MNGSAYLVVMAAKGHFSFVANGHAVEQLQEAGLCLVQRALAGAETAQWVGHLTIGYVAAAPHSCTTKSGHCFPSNLPRCSCIDGPHDTRKSEDNGNAGKNYSKLRTDNRRFARRASISAPNHRSTAGIGGLRTCVVPQVESRERLLPVSVRAREKVDVSTTHAT